jgi:hypothetical protein
LGSILLLEGRSALAGRKLVAWQLFDALKFRTTHAVNGDEALVSFPDPHKELALNNKLKTSLGLRAWDFPAHTAQAY